MAMRIRLTHLGPQRLTRAAFGKDTAISPLRTSGSQPHLVLKTLNRMLDINFQTIMESTFWLPLDQSYKQWNAPGWRRLSIALVDSYGILHILDTSEVMVVTYADDLAIFSSIVFGVVRYSMAEHTIRSAGKTGNLYAHSRKPASEWTPAQFLT